MIHEQFKLGIQAFGVTPDPGFLDLSHTHREAILSFDFATHFDAELRSGSNLFGKEEWEEKIRQPQRKLPKDAPPVTSALHTSSTISVVYLPKHHMQSNPRQKSVGTRILSPLKARRKGRTNE